MARKGTSGSRTGVAAPAVCRGAICHVFARVAEDARGRGAVGQRVGREHHGGRGVGGALVREPVPRSRTASPSSRNRPRAAGAACPRRASAPGPGRPRRPARAPARTSPRRSPTAGRRRSGSPGPAPRTCPTPRRAAPRRPRRVPRRPESGSTSPSRSGSCRRTPPGARAVRDRAGRRRAPSRAAGRPGARPSSTPQRSPGRWRRSRSAGRSRRACRRAPAPDDLARAVCSPTTKSSAGRTTGHMLRAKCSSPVTSSSCQTPTAT